MTQPAPAATAAPHTVVARLGTYFRKRILPNWDLYLIVSVPVAYIVIFHYVPMYGAQIAFRNFSPIKGIWGSPWVGFEHVVRFAESFSFWRIFGNTLGLSIYHLAAGFPIPIMLALSLNYARSRAFKKTVQLVTYAPHFISTVVIVGMILQFLATRGGIVNALIGLAGIEAVNFMGEPAYFKSIYVWTEVWQETGWGAIIYLAALSAIDPELHEAAIVDGASRVQRIVHIDIPGILPTVTILLILRFGRVLFVGFEKVLLMQNPLNLPSSEIIQTYVYKIGLVSAIPNYSYAAAIGLFSAVISFVLLVLVNQFAKRLGQTSLW